MYSKQVCGQPGTFKCARARCKTCSFIRNVEKISGSKPSIKITDHFICTSANVIYCITCTLCKMLYIGETGRRLDDRFREHLRGVEKDDKIDPKPVSRHWILPNHSKQQMAVIYHWQSAAFPCIKKHGKSQNVRRKQIFFKSALLKLTASTNAFHSTNLFYCFSR